MVDIIYMKQDQDAIKKEYSEKREHLHENSLKLKTIVCVLSMCVYLRVCVHSDTPSLM